MLPSSPQLDPARWPELYEAVCQLHGSLESSTVIKQTMAGSIKLTKAGLAFIVLRVSPNHSEFDMCSASSLALDSSPRTRSVWSWEGEPEKITQGVLVKDTQDNPPFIPKPLAEQFRSHTLIVVPLQTSNEFLGLLGVSRMISDDEFTVNDLAILEALSTQAATILHHARRYDTLAALIPTLTAELRTPLFSIKGYVELLCRGMVGPLTDKQKKFLETALLNTNKLTNLVDDLLAVLRIEGGLMPLNIQPTDLRSCIEQSINGFYQFIQDKKLSVTFHFAGIPLVQCDLLKITQVINVLLDNAIKYTPFNGNIDVISEDQSSRVKVSIQDTGIGITLLDQVHLFEKWFRGHEALVREQPGNGLSLYITKSLIELMGGTIGFESEPGKGSTFWFTLPIAE